MAQQTYYQRIIASMDKAKGYDPRHIEAYIRLEHSTLGGLTKERFSREVSIAIACIKEVGHEQAERCARSFGL